MCAVHIDFMGGESMTEQNKKTERHYRREPDGTLYYCMGKHWIKVTEHFADNGKTMTDVVEDLIKHTARKNTPN